MSGNFVAEFVLVHVDVDGCPRNPTSTSSLLGHDDSALTIMMDASPCTRLNECAEWIAHKLKLTSQQSGCYQKTTFLLGDHGHGTCHSNATSCLFKGNTPLIDYLCHDQPIMVRWSVITNPLNLFVRLSGKSMVISVDRSATVKELKAAIQESASDDALYLKNNASERIFFARHMEDSQRVIDYDVRQGSTLVASVAVKGGRRQGAMVVDATRPDVLRTREWSKTAPEWRIAVVRWVQSRQLKHYRRKSNVVLLYCLDYLQRMSTGFLRLARLCFSEFHYVSERYAFLFWLARMLVTVSICTSCHCLMLHSGRCRALVNHFFVCLIISNTLLASGGIARGVLEGTEWFVSK